MMDRTNLYRDRIRWKAKQHHLFEKTCEEYSALLAEKMSAIDGLLSSIFDPILVFWESAERWTVLGSTAITSFYNGSLVSVNLDEINKKVSVDSEPGLPQKNVKTESNFILLEEIDEKIWAPAGPELFALMNILLMFPLAQQCTENAV